MTPISRDTRHTERRVKRRREVGSRFDVWTVEMMTLEDEVSVDARFIIWK